MNPTGLMNSRRSWQVRKVHFLGVVKTTSGTLTNLLRFNAELQSDDTRSDVEVQVDPRALDRLLKSLAMGTHNEALSTNRTPRTITALIRDLLAIDLALDGDAQWDPVRFPRWQLREAAMDQFHRGSMARNGSNYFYFGRS